MEARSLLLSANKVAALHKRAKRPGKNLDDGMTAVRQAVAVLQDLLADD